MRDVRDIRKRLGVLGKSGERRLTMAPPRPAQLARGGSILVVSIGQSHMFPQPKPSPSECLTRLQSIPPIDRLIIERAWECALDRYAHNKTPALQQVELKQRIRAKYKPDKPYSGSSWDRAHREYPELLPWPISYGQRPPWEGVALDADPVEPAREDQAPVGVLVLPEGTVFESADGQRVAARHLNVLCNGVLRWPLGIVAAGFASFLLLDGMDGKYDHVIHWCWVFAESAARLTI